MKIKIIGAGLFGCCIGYELSRYGHNVTIMEQDSDIMTRASKCNHNRIHFGYHYPRSVETAKQSLDGLVSFLVNYRDSLVSHFPNYYMVANDSKVSNQEYIDFCDEVGISRRLEYPDNQFINKDLISTSLMVDEMVFDYDILKKLVKKNIKNIDVRFNTKFDGKLDDCDYLINCTYSNVNEVNHLLNISPIEIKLQDVVVPIFEMDNDPIGLTVMDGPYASIMPKGKNKNQFLLYSVEHSLIKDNNLDIDMIYRESEKLYPFLCDVKKKGYWRTTRALPVNDNDERLSEIFISKENPKIITVLSGKISTCHKVGEDIAKMLS